MSHFPEMPQRQIAETFMIDANCINAMQKDAALNQIERWSKDGVVHIEMPQEAYDEALRGGSESRSRKTRSHVYPLTLAHTQQERDKTQRIAAILSPDGCQDASERNDVKIVFNAWKHHAILVTRDGASRRQPGGILGNKNRLLSEIGVRVVTPEGAVQIIRARINRRDEQVLRRAQNTGACLPEWVGKD